MLKYNELVDRYHEAFLDVTSEDEAYKHTEAITDAALIEGFTLEQAIDAYCDALERMVW